MTVMPIDLMGGFLRRQAGASVVRLRDPVESQDAIFTGFFISPHGHLLTAYHALEVHLLDAGYDETFDMTLEFDPDWYSGHPATVTTTALCKAGWRDPVADVAILQVPFSPSEYLPVSSSRSAQGLMGARLRAYGFTATQADVVSLGEVEGNYLRALPEKSRFRITEIVKGGGHSGGPVIDLQSHSVVGTVVGYYNAEISTGDAAVVSRERLAAMGLEVDLEELEGRWRRQAAVHLRENHPQYRPLNSGRLMPNLPEKFLESRPVVRSVIDRMVTGDGAAFLLHGPPGSGKTTVAVEVATEMSRTEVVRDAFWHDFAIDENRSLQVLIRRLAMYLLEVDGNHEVLGRYPSMPSVDDDELATLLISEALRGNPHLLVFDNLQFLDDGRDGTTAAVVQKLVRGVSGSPSKVLLLSWHRLGYVPAGHVQGMNGLDAQEVRQLLSLYDTELPPGATAIIDQYRQDITCVEMLIRRPEWTAGIGESISATAEPRELHQHWLSKYRDYLSDPAGRILLALAVLDVPSDTAALESVAQVQNFHANLAKLQENPPLVETMEPDATGRLLYYLHYNVKRAFLSISDRGEVLRAHRSSAEYYLDVADRPLLAAKHWLEARVFETAIDTLFARQDDIIGAGEVEDLLKLTAAATNSASRTPHGLYKLNVIQGSCENIRGRYEEARSYWAFALEDAPELLDKATLQNRMADSLRLSSNYPAAGESYEAAVETTLLGRGPAFRKQNAKANLGLAKLDRLSGSYESSLERYRHAHRAFQSVFDENGLVETEFGLGEIKRLTYELGESEDWYRRSFVRAARNRSLERQAYAFWGLGEVQRLNGRHDEALARHMDGLNLCLDVKDVRSEGWALLGMAEVYRAVGERDQAVENYNQAIGRFTAARTHTETAHASLGLAEALRGSGEVDLARYDEVEQVYRQKRLLHALVMCLIAKGAALFQVGQQDAAAAVLADATAITEERRFSYEAQLLTAMRKEGAALEIPLNFP